MTRRRPHKVRRHAPRVGDRVAAAALKEDNFPKKNETK